MCTTCGCGEVQEHGHEHEHEHGHEHEERENRDPARRVQLESDLLAKNDRLAAQNRVWLTERAILTVNLIGSPGSGKTAILEAVIPRLAGEVPAAVLEGDQATDHDAQRIRATGCRVLQVTTGTGCHLDAHMVAHALQRLAPAPESVLFVENVGNLVCPALFDLGERAKVVVMSTTEGEEKPLKYPHVFRAAELLLLNKMDLAPHVGFDVERCVENALRVNPRLHVLRLSARCGDGVDDLCGWLRDRLVLLRRITEA